MDQNEASSLVTEADERDHVDRTERLLELDSLLPDDDAVGFSGQAAMWLFDDVKATWIYGYFTSTVLTAHAFCLLQLSGSMRLLPDEVERPERATSLEDLATLAAQLGLIDVSTQARLVQLHDRASVYVQASLRSYDALLERHVADTESVTQTHPLLEDAREAMTTAVDLLHRGYGGNWG